MSIAAITDDAWQAHVTREAAREIGRWLEGRGRLHQPIAALSLDELGCLAAAAISRFVVLAMERVREQPQGSEVLTAVGSELVGVAEAPVLPAADGTRPWGSSNAIPATASARCPASTPARRWPEGTTA